MCIFMKQIDWYTIKLVFNFKNIQFFIFVFGLFQVIAVSITLLHAFQIIASCL